MLDLTRISDAVRSEGGISRRLFLAYGSALAAIPMVAPQGYANRRPVFAADPFQLGIASGDPDATGVVLWTRLCPKPEEPDGGMRPEAVEVRWEIATDDRMTEVVATGTEVATPQLGHSVHAEVGGLTPGQWYFYRFTSGDAVSKVGRTRTMPKPDATPDQLRFAFASCQHYESGLFTAYDAMIQDDLDLVFHLGDYIYEGPGSARGVRRHSGPEKSKIMTLADYRQRHAQYKSDQWLQAMHAHCPWFVTWDDHEFDNNYANDISEKNVRPERAIDPAVFLEQRANAYQAYYEAMPLRKASVPQGPDMKLYRKASFGRLAEFMVLDTRQYRTDQPNGDAIKLLNDEALSPKNTILGRPQRQWLQSALLQSPATWNVLAQQVMMGMVGFVRSEKGPLYSMDQWPGYAYERMKLVEFLADRKVPNPVVLTGDIHSNWVNDLRVDDREPESAVVATEFVGTSISSGGNGPKFTEVPEQLRAANPGVRFFSRERGYVRCTVTQKSWVSDYVAIEDVTKPNGPTATRASFAVEAGTPGAKKA